MDQAQWLLGRVTVAQLVKRQNDEQEKEVKWM